MGKMSAINEKAFIIVCSFHINNARELEIHKHIDKKLILNAHWN
jgi:hypothetical protein